MKKNIHPTYYPNAKCHCACGAVFEVGSTQESLEVEICSQCHPFYTGKEKIIDVLGRVDKYKKRLEKNKRQKRKKGAKSPPKVSCGNIMADPPKWP